MTFQFTGAGVFAGVSDEDYHADPVPGGSLSSTGARQILSSPAKFRYLQSHREETRAFDIGHAVHAMVLGVGMKVVEIPSDILASNGAASTRAAKEFIDSTRAAGKVPLKAGDFYPVRKMAEAILGHPTARALLERDGTPEASVFATDPVTGEWVRARPDFLPAPDKGRTVVVDVKTAESAHPGQFGRTAAKYGYHQQAPHYLDAVTLTRGDDSPLMRFVIAEKSDPWLVSVCELDADAIDKGRQLNREALDIWHRCRETGMWPGYGDEVHTVSLPVWALIDDDDVELKL